MLAFLKVCSCSLRMLVAFHLFWILRKQVKYRLNRYCATVPLFTHTIALLFIQLAFKKLNLNNNNKKPLSCDFSLTRTLAINICFPEKQQEKMEQNLIILCCVYAKGSKHVQAGRKSTLLEQSLFWRIYES